MTEYNAVNFLMGSWGRGSSTTEYAGFPLFLSHVRTGTEGTWVIYLVLNDLKDVSWFYAIMIASLTILNHILDSSRATIRMLRISALEHDRRREFGRAEDRHDLAVLPVTLTTC